VAELPVRRDPECLVGELAAGIRRILLEHPQVGECLGIGVAVSGLVELDSGRLRFSPTLGWKDVDLRGPLQAAVRLPVVVENSTKACVLAQVWAVRGDPPVDGPVAFVNVSDGVGVGIAVDGKLLRGAQNVAGEFGHVPLDRQGPVCSCGQRGCWESFVSKRAVIARYRGTDPSWPVSAEPGPVTIDDVLAGARRGEERALLTVRETGRLLGQGLATMIKAIDPRRIYVGGEITRVWDLVLPAVRETLREDAVVRDSRSTQILPVPLEEYPRLRGAAALITAPAFAATVVS
jgi:predicted NBD/HSP70 family sugar kinase